MTADPTPIVGAVPTPTQLQLDTIRLSAPVAGFTPEGTTALLATAVSIADASRIATRMISHAAVADNGAQLPDPLVDHAAALILTLIDNDRRDGLYNDRKMPIGWSEVMAMVDGNEYAEPSWLPHHWRQITDRVDGLLWGTPEDVLIDSWWPATPDGYPTGQVGAIICTDYFDGPRYGIADLTADGLRIARFTYTGAYATLLHGLGSLYRLSGPLDSRPVDFD